MQNHILDYLTETVQRVPEKPAYSNGAESLNFREVYEQSRAVGTYLHHNGIYKKPVVVFMDRHPKTIAAFFGVITGGNYYVPIDVEMPEMRIRLILENVQSEMILCDASTRETAEKFDYCGQIVSYDEIICTEADESALREIYERAIDTDPIYIVFTSGSTGIPKGVAACHRSVIDYIEQLSEVLAFDETTVFGSQTPLYVDACLKELYPTLKFGATTYLIDKELFMFPMKLIAFLNEYRINTVCWVVSALTMVSAFGALEIEKPKYLRLIAFGSEAFPIKQFHKWTEALPEAKFVNLYGPTEGTGMCCYYIVDRKFAPGETIPIGRPFKNTEIILLKENNERAGQGERGEICIRGTSLTLGYYNNFEKTSEVFVQNPLNPYYSELIYKTGDIGIYNDRGELEFVSRKDYQIKHMGYRIELGEIEANVDALDGIKMAACIYDDIKNKIVLYYIGEPEKKDISVILRDKLPRYMLPNSIIRLERMPFTTNGKIDRMALKKDYQMKYCK